MDRARSLLNKMSTGGKWLALTLAVAVISAVATLLVTDIKDERDAATNPFDVRVEHDLGVLFAEQPFNWTPYAFMLDRDLERIPPPPSGHCRTWWSWARGLGGVDARKTQFRVYLTGRTDEAVILNRAKVHVRAVRSPRPRYLLDCDAGGAMVNPRHLDVDLDHRQVSLNRGDEDKPFLFRLSAGDIEVFDVTASTSRCDCRWWMELFFVQGERQRSVQIGGPDDTFRTVAARLGTKVRAWEYGWKLPRRQTRSSRASQ